MNNFKYLRDPQEDNRVVSVLNYGAFIARVELIYFFQGQYYYFENDELLVLQEFKMNVPLTATNVEIYVYVEDIFRGDYLLFRNEYSVADDACFLLWGLSFAAQYKAIPCTSPGLVQSILPPAIFVPPQAIYNNCSLYINN